jgi:rod shape determining protein RodA
VAVHLLESRVRARREERGALALARHVDVVLVLSTFAVAAIGVVMVYSATRTVYPLEPTYYVKRQLLYLVIGAGIGTLCAVVDYRRLEELGYFLYGIVVAALMAVFVVGRSIGAGSGAQSTASTVRWIPLGPVQFQPSEFGVLGVIVAVGLYVHHHDKELTPKRLVVMTLFALVPLLLVFKQPDVGTAVIIAVVFAGLLVFAGVRGRYLLAFATLGAAGVAAMFGLHLLHGYELQRFSCFLHPNQNLSGACYELNVVKEAIGAGGLHGTGLFQGAVTNLQYVPEQYADFIFSALGEQTGFVGGVVLLGLFALMALRIFRAMQLAKDTLGRMICGGALVFLVFSVFQNVGMNVGIMPITGIPLPFVSYGGSALLAFFAMVGLVLNVEMRRYRSR